MNATLVTVTPVPLLNAAESRRANPAPGSKKPRPPLLEPVTDTTRPVCPGATVAGDTDGDRRGRRGKQTREPHRVRAGSVHVLLQGPERLVVVGIDARIGVVAPPLHGIGRRLHVVGGPLVVAEGDGRVHRSGGIGGEPAGEGRVHRGCGPGARHPERHMALSVGHDRGHPVVQRIRSGAVEDGARLRDRRRRPEVLELVPPHAVAAAAGRGGARRVDLHVMSGPQAAVADDALQQAIVDAVEGQRAVGVRDGDGESGRRHVHGDVAREARGPRRVGHAAQLQHAELGIVDADDVALVRVGVDVVHPLRRVDAVARAAGQHAVELRHGYLRARCQRRFVEHVDRGGIEGQRTRRTGTAELVGANVERVFIEAERRIVAQARRRAAHAAERARVHPVRRWPRWCRRRSWRRCSPRRGSDSGWRW